MIFIDYFAKTIAVRKLSLDLHSMLILTVRKFDYENQRFFALYKFNYKNQRFFISLFLKQGITIL